MLLLVLVLLGHWAGLAWLRDQVPVFTPLVPMAEPLFTRLLVPSQPVALTRPRQPRPRRTAVPPKVAPAVTEAELAPASTGEPDPQDHPVESQANEAPAETPPQSSQAEPEAPPPMAAASAPIADETTPAPDTWPADTRVSYRLTGYYRGKMYGNARVQWQRQQNRYQVRIDLRMALFIGVSLISQGEVSDTGLTPRIYEEQFPASLRGVTFEAGLVRFQDGRQELQVPGLQDTASQFVELGHRFSSGRETLKVGSEVRVWLARPQGMALWTYDVIAKETLATPELGPVSAFHLRPRPIANPSGPITAEIWFAPSLQYLPVRIRISLGADNFVDLLVDHIEQAAQAR